ncbi:hypothetical protein FRC01_008059, partial [Tulasnella sp. 417]
TGDTFISINHGQLRYLSGDFHHSGQIDYAWITSACVLLLLFLIVRVALRRDSHPRNLQSESVLNASASLESRDTVKCLVPRVQTTYPPTFTSRGLIEAGPPTPIAAPTPLEKSHQDLSPRSPAEGPQNTGLVDPSKGLGTVDQTVALKEQHRIVAWITLLFVEGSLSLEPGLTSSHCGDVVQWAIVFHPRDRDCPTRPLSNLNTHTTTNQRLFDFLFRGISTIHPWASQLAHVFEVPGHIVIESNEVDPDATPIIPPAIPVPVTPFQIATNAEPEVSTELDPFNDSTGAYGIDAEEHNTAPIPVVTAPPGFTFNDSAPIPGPVNQAVVAPSQLQLTISNLATRAEQRYQALAGAGMQSMEADVEDQQGAYVAEEDGSAIHPQEENTLNPNQKKTKRGGNREARRKRRNARVPQEIPEAGPSGQN